jgi:hypothetical protein
VKTSEKAPAGNDLVSIIGFGWRRRGGVSMRCGAKEEDNRVANSQILQWIYWVLVSVYTAGYCIYLFAAGWAAWPKMTFWDWLTHVSYESVYALAWPVLLILSWLGYR